MYKIIYFQKKFFTDFLLSFNDEVFEDNPEDMFDDWHQADEVELPDVFEEKGMCPVPWLLLIPT